MAVNQIITQIDTETGWLNISDHIGSRGTYLIALKGTKSDLDIFDVKDLRYIVFEFGIDSGISGEPISIFRARVDFNDQTSSKKEINDRTAFVKLPPLPSDLYMRVVSFTDVNSKEYTKGTMPVSINMSKF